MEFISLQLQLLHHKIWLILLVPKWQRFWWSFLGVQTPLNWMVHTNKAFLFGAIWTVKQLEPFGRAVACYFDHWRSSWNIKIEKFMMSCGQLSKCRILKPKSDREDTNEAIFNCFCQNFNWTGFENRKNEHKRIHNSSQKLSNIKSIDLPNNYLKVVHMGSALIHFNSVLMLHRTTEVHIQYEKFRRITKPPSEHSFPCHMQYELIGHMYCINNIDGRKTQKWKEKLL